MGSTNFKQWNPDYNNMETDTQFLGDQQRLGGAVAGVFPSSLANKFYGQLSAMVTALAQMLANKDFVVEDGSAGTTGHDFAALVQVLGYLATAKDIQNSEFIYAPDDGSANVYHAVYDPPVSQLIDGMSLGFKAGNSNTGASTFAPDSMLAKPIYGLAHSDLQGNEIVQNGDILLVYNASANGGNGAWVLLNNGGGPLQIKDATHTQHAITLQQGDARYLKQPSQSQAYPTILHSSQKLAVTGSGGNITVGAGRKFVIRDSTLYTTVSTVLGPTQANKTYHLRFAADISDGRDNFGGSFYGAKGISAESFYLIDVTDSSYNPASSNESNSAFDSKLDDMLVSRVVTNGSNVATITTLANVDRLLYEVEIEDSMDNSLAWTYWHSVAYNWARTPRVASPNLRGIKHQNSAIGDTNRWTFNGQGALAIVAVRVSPGTMTRYGSDIDYAYDDVDTHNNGYANISFLAMA